MAVTSRAADRFGEGRGRNDIQMLLVPRANSLDADHGTPVAERIRSTGRNLCGSGRFRDATVDRPCRRCTRLSLERVQRLGALGAPVLDAVHRTADAPERSSPSRLLPDPCVTSCTVITMPTGEPMAGEQRQHPRRRRVEELHGLQLELSALSRKSRSRSGSNGTAAVMKLGLQCLGQARYCFEPASMPRSPFLGSRALHPHASNAEPAPHMSRPETLSACGAQTN